MIRRIRKGTMTPAGGTMIVQIKDFHKKADRRDILTTRTEKLKSGPFANHFAVEVACPLDHTGQRSYVVHQAEGFTTRRAARKHGHTIINSLPRQ